MDKNRLQLAKYWMEKAWKCLETAKHEYKRNNLDFVLTGFIMLRSMQLVLF